jgi:hypothetical protein
MKYYISPFINYLGSKHNETSSRIKDWRIGIVFNHSQDISEKPSLKTVPTPPSDYYDASIKKKVV